MDKVFEFYKPLQNELCQVPLIQSLGVIRAYVQHLQFNKALPQDIEVIPQFINAKNKVEKGVFEWELETLAREILINSPEAEKIYLLKDLRRWSHFSNVVNKLKDLENNIASIYPKKSILVEIHRIAHRQFPWQRKPNTTWVGRYFMIFGHPKLDSIIQRIIGISSKDVYIIGLGLTGFYLDNFALHYPSTISIEGIDNTKFELFVNRLSVDLSQMKKLLNDAQQFNENFAYTFNPMRRHPLIRMKVNKRDSIVSPLPTLLFWRFTSGIYYEICDEKDFGEAFGASFQNYVGEVIRRAISSDTSIHLYSEKEYYVGKNRKDSVDWIIDQMNAALFTEVKTKRLRVEAKIELVTLTVLMEELDKMADFIIKMYETIRDYRENLYLHYKYDPNKKIFPLVLTLEDWYLFDAPEKLRSSVSKKFDEHGLNKDWLDEMPYSISSIEEFENVIQIISKVGINNFMSKKVFDIEKRTWPFESFMPTEFKEEYSKSVSLFPEVMSQIYPTKMHS